MGLFSWSHLLGHPFICHVGQQCRCWTLHVTFSTQYLHTRDAIGANDFFRFKPSSLTSIFAEGDTFGMTTKTFWLHFLTQFQMVCVKFDAVLKQFKLNILILPQSESHVIKGNNCCLADNQKPLALYAFGL